MGKTVTLTIDNRTVTVPENTLVVDAAKKIGIDIPVFCYHPKMEPVGMCRMCLVELGRPMMDRATGQPVLNEDGTPKIQMSPKLETACTVPVSEGMVVITDTKQVNAARKDVIEFLLTSHPLDCPICDKGGECPLQNLTRAFGPGQSRFILEDKMRLAKHLPLGDLIYLDRERCIQCARCIRFQDEIVGEPVIGFYHRGRALEIVTYSDPPFDSVFSGNTTDICPVGALTTADFRFAARPWEWKRNASICTQCPVGCNTAMNVRREAKAGGDWVIKRVMPRQNELVNEIWICDKGRFGYHYAESKERLGQPLVRKERGLTPVSWEEALDLVEQRMRTAGAGLVSLVGGRLSNEDLFNIQQVTRKLGGQSLLMDDMGGGELVQHYGLGQGSNFAEMGKGTVIVIAASDLQEEAPIWWLRVKQAADRGAVVILLNPRPTRMDAHARYLFRYNYGEEAAALRKLAAGADHSDELVRAAADDVAKAENLVVIYGSEGTGLTESTALAQAAADLLAAGGHVGKPNNGLLAVWPHNNTMGAWDMGFRPAGDLADRLGKAGLAWISAADPAGDDPALRAALEKTGFVVVQELFLTETAQLADVVLPVLAFTEREGTFTNGERRVQRFYPAITDHEGPLADFTIAGKLGQRLGLQMETNAPALVMKRIAESVPAYEGLNYAKISAFFEQWPIVGRGDLYYGGTGYENKQGLGVQLATGAERGLEIAAAAPAAEGESQPLPQGSLRLVPVTRLYDHAVTLRPSAKLLHSRMTGLQVWLNPATAESFGLSAGGSLRLEGEGWALEGVRLVLDEHLPENTLAAPRSVGIPTRGPAVVRVSALASEVEA